LRTKEKKRERERGERREKGGNYFLPALRSKA
jgi:hypothetical protein